MGFWLVMGLWLSGCRTTPMQCPDNTQVDCPDVEASEQSQARFDNPATCAGCHPLQYQEWSGSVMHYAMVSPTFNAFELLNRVASGGAIAPNGERASFCTECHSPVGAGQGQFSDFIDADSAQPAIFDLTQGDTATHGVSCDFCHQVTEPDLHGSLLGDGIANASVHAVATGDASELTADGTKQGPLNTDLSPVHGSEENGYLESAEFCGSCHDVRLPQEDAVTEEEGIQPSGDGSGPFSRLENLFTEWESSPWGTGDNPFGRVMTCQDCHMSLYPMEDPGTYPEVPIATGDDAPVRKHALHAFTAVSMPLTALDASGVDSVPYPERMPDFKLLNVTTDAVDDFGYPLGQAQRREQMLQAACRISLDGTPGTVSSDDTMLPIAVVVENIGAGHNVPSGFSQEREVWIELTVTSGDAVLYRSGYLVDSAHPSTGETEPDGLLHDEELHHGHFETTRIDGEILEVFVDGPDRDQRPDTNLGLVNFQNAFVRVDERDIWHVTDRPSTANHMDNSRSLAPFTPTTFRYDIPLTGPLTEPVHVAARLRYRAFPPHFLRMLAGVAPELVDEALVDRNTIVDMATVESIIEVDTGAGDDGGAGGGRRPGRR